MYYSPTTIQSIREKSIACKGDCTQIASRRLELFIISVKLVDTALIISHEVYYVCLYLWNQKRFTAVLVTHDVDEAIFLADRVAVLTHRPSTISEVIDTNLPRPRHSIETERTISNEAGAPEQRAAREAAASERARSAGNPATPAPDTT